MKYILFLILSLCCLQSIGQDTFYEFIHPGKFKIGYCDTLLYNDSIPYAQYGYEGASPLFVQIWHPVKKQRGETLAVKDFTSRVIPEQLTRVYDELCARMDESFISYNLTEDFPSYNEISYGAFTHEAVLDTLKQFKTNSSFARIPKKLKYPVILYHHGSQGMSDENFIMAEYFASRGYIFIAANFHLPYEEMVYGLQEGVQNNHSSIRAVNAFARSITENDHLFYIGHSWGAQVGWTFLYEEGKADAFVSMETTIELKTDTNEIKDKWAFVYEAVKTEHKKYQLPVLLFANTQKDEPFHFFENTSTKEMIFASTKAEFGHESYTSGYLLRYFFNDQFPQPDADALRNQIVLYGKHLEIIAAFFDAVIKRKSADLTRFEGDFWVNWWKGGE